MNRKITGLAAAVGLAGTGTLVLVGYVQAAEERALAGERLVPVLVVAEPIQRGTPVDELAGAVRVESVPAKVRASGAVSDIADLGDTVAVVDLVPGEQVLSGRFGAVEVVGPVDLPEGLDQVTVSLASERAVGGRIRAGDRVAVLASYDSSGGGTAITETVLRDVPVLAVTGAEGGAVTDEAGGSTAAQPGAQLLVTLAVEPSAAERVVHAAEHGRVWLSGGRGVGQGEVNAL